MKCKNRYCFSSIGRKQIMAVAGLGLCLFVLMHAAGNMLLFKSAESYNMYSHAIVTNPFIYVIEIGLLAIFLIHIISSVLVTLRNRRARPDHYALSAKGDKATTLAVKTLMAQGIVILVFVCHHLITFKYGPYYEVTYGGVMVRDLFRLVKEVFQNPLYVVWYVFAVSLLCFHLTHGFYSSLQTLSLNHPRYTPKLKLISVVFGILVSAMFAAQPIFMLIS